MRKDIAWRSPWDHDQAMGHGIHVLISRNIYSVHSKACLPIHGGWCGTVRKYGGMIVGIILRSGFGRSVAVVEVLSIRDSESRGHFISQHFHFEAPYRDHVCDMTFACSINKTWIIVDKSLGNEVVK